MDKLATVGKLIGMFMIISGMALTGYFEIFGAKAMDEGYKLGYAEHNQTKAMEYYASGYANHQVDSNFTLDFQSGYYDGYYKWKTDQYVRNTTDG